MRERREGNKLIGYNHQCLVCYIPESDLGSVTEFMAMIVMNLVTFKHELLFHKPASASQTYVTHD